MKTSSYQHNLVPSSSGHMCRCKYPHQVFHCLDRWTGTLQSNRENKKSHQMQILSFLFKITLQTSYRPCAVNVITLCAIVYWSSESDWQMFTCMSHVCRMYVDAALNQTECIRFRMHKLTLTCVLVGISWPCTKKHEKIFYFQPNISNN